MASAKVYGPYKARKGYRVVVVEAGARKSVLVPSIAAGESLRAELEQALLQRRAPPLAEALGEYQDYLQRVRGAVTAASITRAIQRFVGETAALGSITPARAAALYAAETRRIIAAKHQPVAAASHRTVLGQCKRFYAWACEHGYVAQNPFAAVQPVGKPRAGKSQLRLDEARRFVGLAVAKAQHGDLAATAALLALLLGLRAGEVLGRSVRDLDDDGRVLWITRGKTDNARRRLTVPEVLRPLLLRLAADKPAAALLLGPSRPGSNRPLGDAWLWAQVQKLCAEAGVPRVCTHSLRGLHSTLALEAGATASAVAAALGHGSFQITAKHYAAPGTVERVRSRVVAQTLRSATAAPPESGLAGATNDTDDNSVPDDIAVPDDTDPAQLLRAFHRLPPQLRAELRKAMRETSEL